MKTIIIALLISFACSSELSVVEEQQLTWNPEGLLKCLTEVAPYAKDAIELINLIKSKDYEAAFEKAIALVSSGSEVVKKCIEYIVGSSSELTVNWSALGQCLEAIARRLGLWEKLSTALKYGNIEEVRKIILEILLSIGEVPKECKRFYQ